MIRGLMMTGLGGALLALALPAHAAEPAAADRQSSSERRSAPKVMLPGDDLRAADSRESAPAESRSPRFRRLPHPFREQAEQPEARA